MAFTPAGSHPLDIHKPKPVHSLREFLSEIAVVTTGIVIALLGEQSVEWMHWRHEVEVERRSLLVDAQAAINVVHARQTEQGCVDARLNQVHVLIQRHERRQPLKIIGPIGDHMRDVASLGTWQIALAEQVPAHMSHDERLAFSSAFATYQLWNERVYRESAAWNELAPLQEPDLLGDQDWTKLKSAYWDAKQINIGMQSFATFILKTQNLGLRPDGTYNAEVPGYVGGNAAMCRPFVDLR